jgi:hypothetical protein
MHKSRAIRRPRGHVSAIRQLTKQRQSVTDSTTPLLALCGCQLRTTMLNLVTAARSALGILPRKCLIMPRGRSRPLRGRGASEGSMPLRHSCVVEKLPLGASFLPAQPHTFTILGIRTFGLLSAFSTPPALLRHRGSAICLSAFTFDSATAIHDIAGSHRPLQVNLAHGTALACELGREHSARARSSTNS